MTILRMDVACLSFAEAREHKLMISTLISFDNNQPYRFLPRRNHVFFSIQIRLQLLNEDE